MSFWKRLLGLEKSPEPTQGVQLKKNVMAVEHLGPMHTLPAHEVVEPFSKINYWALPNGGKRVRVYFLMERPIEGAQTGVALDGSASMQGPFGRLLIGQPSEADVEHYKKLNMVHHVEQDGRTYRTWTDEAVTDLIKRGIFRYTENVVEPQARAMTAYLSKFDADGGTTVIYWATGDGRKIEVLGDLRGEQCPNYAFKGPGQMGNSTHLLPAVKYFVERFAEARWGMYIFITDGKLDDLAEVKKYCINLARQIEKKQRNDLKLVLIGVGDEIDEAQMEELDNLETGTNVDLWDHKIAKEMKQLAEIFAEVVSESVIMVPNDGVIRDEQRNVIKDYRDSGLPALLMFDVPPKCHAFTLEVGGNVISQELG